jgi:competence protein ComEA
MNFEELRERLPIYTTQQKQALAVLSILGIGFSIFLFVTTRGSAIAQESPKPVISISPINSTIMVHVAGKVKKPDVYTLLQGSRVADAIRAAGGALQSADLSDINLARVLNDGEQIYVGNFTSTGSKNSGSTRKFSGVLNINRASKSDFDSLSGIGPVIAGRIVTYRVQNGPFMAIDDLLKVAGVGPKTLERIRSRLTL